MPTVISRRRLLSSGLKTGLGVVVLRNVALNSGVVWAHTTGARSDRFQAAYERLDEFR